MRQICGRTEHQKSLQTLILRWTFHLALLISLFTNCETKLASTEPDLANLTKNRSDGSSRQLRISSPSSNKEKGSFLSANMSDPQSLVLEPNGTLSSRLDNSSKTRVLEDTSRSETALETGSLVSCQDRCGDRKSFPCSCTDICIVNGNCCQDMEGVCSSMFESGASRFKHLRGAEVKCSTMTSTFMIMSCPSNDSASGNELLTENIVVKDEIGHKSNSSNMVSLGNESFFEGKSRSQPNDSNAFLSLILDAPVTDRTTGLVYRNQAVARCNGVLELVTFPWAVQVQVIALSNPVDLASLNDMISTDSVAYSPPSLLTKLSNSGGSQCVPDSKRLCKQKWLTNRPDLEQKCFDGGITYHETIHSLAREIFDNIHCLLCNSGTYNYSKPLLAYLPTGKRFKFSLVASLMSGDVLEVKTKPEDGTLAWDVLKCSVAPGDRDGGECSKSKCYRDFEKRPDGECRVTQKFVVAISGEDCSFMNTEETKAKLKSIIQCYLVTLRDGEVDMKTIQFDTVFDNRLNRSLVQLSVLAYVSIVSWTRHLEYFLRELLMLIHDANFCCEPHPPPYVCSGSTCRLGGSTIPLIKTKDFYQAASTSFPGRGQGWKPIRNYTLIICAAFIPTWSTSKAVLRCLREPVYLSQLPFYTRAANVTCFGKDVGKEALSGQRYRGCNNSHDISSDGTWFVFVVFGIGYLLNWQSW